MKLYVWYDVLSDHYEGIAFALASSLEEAHQLVVATRYLRPGDTDPNYRFPYFDGKQARVHDSPMGFSMSSGG